MLTRSARRLANSQENALCLRSSQTANLSLVKMGNFRTSTARKRKQPEKLDSSQLHLALENCSLNYVSPEKSPRKSPRKSSDLSDSFQTAKENSSLKLNWTANTNNESEIEEGDTEIPTLSKSAFDLQQNYEELEELPDQCDYRAVKFKENVFIGYEEQKNSLNFLIQTAIGRGESGTVLVLGGPGSGKTSLGKLCLFFK